MFEADDFRDKLVRVIESEARRQGLSNYQPAAVLFLQGLAKQNEAILMEAEERKAAWARRDISDALNSARELVRQVDGGNGNGESQ